MVEVLTEHDHALNGSKLQFEVKGTSTEILTVDCYVGSMTSFGTSSKSLPIRFEVLEPKNQQLQLNNGSATFCGRFVFAGEAVDMCRCMAAVVVKAGNQTVGQSKAITLCTYQIMLVDVNTRPYETNGGTYCEATCSLFAYKKDDKANANRPLNVTLLDDAGYRVPAGSTTWFLAQSPPQHQQIHSRTIVHTDLEGQASFSIFVVRHSVFDFSGGFRLHIACDWQSSNELFPSIPTTSRRFECVTQHPTPTIPLVIGQHGAFLPEGSGLAPPLVHPIPPPPPPMPGKRRASFSSSASSQITATPSSVEADDALLLSSKQFRHLGWAPIAKDGLLQCVCCRAVRSDSPFDVITHRPNCTLHNQLRQATSEFTKK